MYGQKSPFVREGETLPEFDPGTYQTQKQTKQTKQTHYTYGYKIQCTPTDFICDTEMGRCVRLDGDPDDSTASLGDPFTVL